MIQSFSDQETTDIFNGVRTKQALRLVPLELWPLAQKKLGYLNAATKPHDMQIPPGNRLKHLDANLWSVRINDFYRITFGFEGGNAIEVRISKHYA